jgi:hypothetical protein
MIRPNDEPNAEIPPLPTPIPPSAARSRGLKFKVAALVLTLVSALAGTGLARWLKNEPPVTTKPAVSHDGIPARLFKDWDKPRPPDFVLLLSAQQHGYLLPCGCSNPQIGGLERRYNFLQLLKQRGWPVVAIDLGDVPQKSGPAKLPNVQGLIKYRYSMMALKEMGYLAVGIGEYEAALSLRQVEGIAINEPKPALLAANLSQIESNPAFKAMETETVPGVNVKVGVTSLVGPTVAETIKDSSVKFLVGVPQGTPSTADVLRQQLNEMQTAKVDLPILLYHGLASPRKKDFKVEPVECAKQFPQFPVIVCLSEEDEPPAQATVVDHKDGTKNYVFRLGHKGKNVGVLGVYRTGNNDFTFKYQLVEMGTEYETAKEKQAGHPIIKMMEDYTAELKKDNYLSRYGQGLHIVQALGKVDGLRNPGNGEPTYIGSKACSKCHDRAYDIWLKSDHAHAYKTLVDAKRPSLRQYDGECIVCHTVGFRYKTGFQDEVSTPLLKDVGCESCHGPGSLHAKNPDNQEWRDRMNQQWRGAKKKDLAIEQFCVTCHDTENDVHWIHNGQRDPFKEKWGKIIHNNE